jgi:hypothetical protein
MCSQGDCQTDPAWTPVLEVRRRETDRATRVRFLALGYCDEHKRATKLANLLSDEGHVKISKYLRERGKPSPSQKLTTLAWERCESPSPPAVDRTTPDDSMPF